MFRFAALIIAPFLLLVGPSASKETVNDITQLNPIIVEQVVAPRSVDEVRTLVAAHSGPISIGGGRYSQGGQTACSNCLFLDMRGLNRIVSVDVKGRLIAVEAGATWRQIQEAIDPLNFSLKIMQSYANFTVGGSLSVNAHGRYVGQGPIISSVRSIKLVTADGALLIVSRTENADLFYAAIGGYGGVGVIVEATLDLSDNTPLERVSKRMPLKDYRTFFRSNIAGSNDAVLHNAVLYPPDYKRVNAVTFRITNKPVSVSARLASRARPNAFQRGMLSFITHAPGGKWVRENVYDRFGNSSGAVVWRNYEASRDVESLEPASRSKTTYALQEYFVPEERLEAFAAKMAGVLKRHRVNALNVSIRHANADRQSLLSWAPRPVFAFVIYYEQGVSATDRQKVRGWTAELIEAALNEGGAYYLPYQIVATKEQFLRAYPGAPAFFEMKRRIDPDYKFRNQLWEAYYAP